MTTYRSVQFKSLTKTLIFCRVKELFQVNQIDTKTISNGHVGTAKKKFVLQSEISTNLLIIFSKIVKIYPVEELFNANQIDIPDYQ